MSKLSIVIPCYGSEKTIKGVVCELIETISMRESFDYEIILVNDSSPDNVFDVIKELCKNNNKIKGIALSKNFGQHAALMAGYSVATGDIIVCLDDDGQTPANEIFTLVDALGEETDVVIAKYKNKEHNLFRNFGSKVNDFMARKLISKPKNLELMSYFACKRYIIEEIKRYNGPYPYMSGLLLRSSNKIKNVEVNHRKREIGSSGYTLGKLLSLWLNGFTSFSVKPLRIATIIGVVIATLGFMYGIFTIIQKFINSDIVLGYSSLMSALLFIGGMIMIMLGLIGEYVGRIYININSSPQYIIRETLNIEKLDK